MQLALIGRVICHHPLAAAAESSSARALPLRRDLASKHVLHTASATLPGRMHTTTRVTSVLVCSLAIGSAACRRRLRGQHRSGAVIVREAVGEAGDEEEMDKKVSQLQQEMVEALATIDPDDDKDATLRFFDALYLRYTRRHGSLPSGELGHRMALWWALRDGDLDWLRSDLQNAEPGSWDFVFPPVGDCAKAGAGEAREKVGEGWARSPLALIAWPTGGYMGFSFLPGVKKAVRLDLMREALSSGVASPAFPGSYWGSAAVQATLKGDTKVLAVLQEAGLDIPALRVEWVLHNDASFNLAHVAAFAGQHEALLWMRKACFASKVDKRELKQFFDAADCTGSTPLDVVMQVSKAWDCAEALVECRADPFRVHPQTGASPMSVALELNPGLAETMIAGRTERSYQWTGAESLRFVSQKTGCRLMLEELIVASGRTSLAELPSVAALIEAKWQGFALERYRYDFLLYTVMFALVFFGVVAEFIGNFQGLASFQIPLLVAAFLIAVQFLINASEELSASGLDIFLQVGSSRLDAVIAAYVVATAVVHVGCFAQNVDVPSLMVGIDAAVQIVMFWRFLLYLSVDSSVPKGLGPFLVTITSLVNALLQPSGLFLLALLTFANAFAIILNYGSPREPLTYKAILQQELQLVLGGAKSAEAGSSLFAGLPLSSFGEFILLLFVAVVSIGTFGLVQSAVKKTLDSVSEAPRAKFLMNRMKLIASIERELLGEPGGSKILDRFYAGLESQSGRVEAQRMGAMFLRPR